MPLSQLVALRPSKDSRPDLLPSFRDLFAKHPRVAKLDAFKSDENRLMLEWTKLRSELKGQVNPTRMHYAAQEHLEHTLKLDPATRDKIEGYWSAHSFRDTDVRNEAKARAKMSQQKQKDQTSKRNRNRATRKELGLVPSFEELMAEHKIPHGLNPVELAKQTAVFTDRYDPKSLSTFELRRYMRNRHYSKADEDVAIGLRRLATRKKLSRIGATKLREKKRQERAGNRADPLGPASQPITFTASDALYGPSEQPIPSSPLEKRPAKKLRPEWWKSSKL